MVAALFGSKDVESREESDSESESSLEAGQSFSVVNHSNK